MGVIIDTSVWVNVEHGRLAPADVASLTGEEPVYVAPPVIAELEYGVQRAQTSAQRHRRAQAVSRISKKPCLSLDRETAVVFGRLAAELDSRGTPATYRVQDLWLAALAIQHNLGILTQNERDFAGIPGLRVMVVPA